MLQRGIEADALPWCVEHDVSVVVYWPLMKGLLAGRLPRGHQFPTTDSRHKYPMFQGEEFRKNQDFVDALRPIAADAGRTVSQVVLNWTIHQPGITAALCGATVAEQLRENAGASGLEALGPANGPHRSAHRQTRRGGNPHARVNGSTVVLVARLALVCWLVCH